MLPEVRSGTSRISGSPATGLVRCLAAAASALIALSKASGPSTMPPWIWPRSAIFARAAASIVAGCFGVTSSTAASTASFGRSIPKARHRSMALRAISALVSRSGSMLIAASVTTSGLWYSGTSRMKQWLMRRSVRSPPSRATTAASISSVCRLPFISAPARPSRTRATARSAEAWLCGVSSMAMPARSRPAAAAAARIRAAGPTRMGRIRPALAASSAPSRLAASTGCTTAQGRAGPAATALAISRASLSSAALLCGASFMQRA